MNYVGYVPKCTVEFKKVNNNMQPPHAHAHAQNMCVHRTIYIYAYRVKPISENAVMVQ